MRPFGCGAGNGAFCRPVGLDVDFDSHNAGRREPRLDPSEMVFMALNTGFCRDMGVMAMMLKASGETRTVEAQGEFR
ncbi:hypothetical protein IMCC20628_00071 [Hoeflea sp. IMCC20628]|nr:hypothetical protein IMCC20628_00071 [Hoeflea sp. IMCC20628]